MPSRSTQHAKDPVLRKLGKTIRAAREELGYSQEGFALVIGMDRSYYGAVERGENNVALLNLLKIAKALKINVSDLLAQAKL